MAASTSFRISDTTEARLASRATREGMTGTALLDQLIVEGIDQLDYPGITGCRARLCPVRTGSEATIARHRVPAGRATGGRYTCRAHGTVHLPRDL